MVNTVKTRSERFCARSVRVFYMCAAGGERRGGGLAKLLQAYSDRHSSTSMELDLINRNGVSLTVQVRSTNTTS
jgi:hypothetical protein